MQATLEFSRLADEPRAVYVCVVPTEARAVLALIGWKIDRGWPTLRDRAAELSDLLEKVGDLPERTELGGATEGDIVFAGHSLVFADNYYDEGRAVLLTLAQCKVLLSRWTELLLSRPHKAEALPPSITFEYLAHGQGAVDEFHAPF